MLRVLILVIAIISVASIPFLSSYLPHNNRSIVSIENYREDINGMIADYIKNNPKEIISSVLSNLEKDKKENTGINIKSNIDAIYDASYPSMKSKKFDSSKKVHRIVEFFDYYCGYCRQMMPRIHEILNDIENTEYIARDYPVMHPENSKAIARAGLFVYKINPSLYFDYQNKAFDIRANLKDKSIDQGIEEVLNEIGIDMNLFKKIKNDKKIADEVDIMLNNNLQLGSEKLKFDSVPIFIIDGVLYAGSIEVSELKSLLTN